MDETLAELFTRHPSCGCFEGNPIEAFGAFIADEEYGMEEMPDALGLYGGWYTIVFHRGESLHVVCAGKVKANLGTVLIQGSITSIVRSVTIC